MARNANLGININLKNSASAGLRAFKNSLGALVKDSQKFNAEMSKAASSLKFAAKSGAVTGGLAYGFVKATGPARNLQEAMLEVKRNIASSAKDADDLNNMLAKVEANAQNVAAEQPFSAREVVQISNSLLKAGLELGDITGEAGAAFAASALSALSGAAPEAVGDALANIGAQFSLKGGDFGELADWLARVDEASATSLPALIQGIKTSGASSQALGISVKDVVTTLGVLAPLGEEAGGSFKSMLISITSNSKESQKAMKKVGLELFDSKGQFIGMAAAAEQMREKFGKIENSEKRMGLLTAIFGRYGANAANTIINSAKGFDEIEKSAQKSLTLMEKIKIWSEGTNASFAKLGGTFESAMAEAFKAALPPMRNLADSANELLSAFIKIAREKEGITKTISGMGAGSIALAAGATAAAGAAGLFYGARGIAGGVFGLGAGVAKGKALEAVSGVPSVFVVNMPSGFGMTGGGAMTAGGVAGPLAQVGSAAKITARGLAVAGAQVLAVTATFAAAYKLGTWLDKKIPEWMGFDTKISDVVGESQSMRAISGIVNMFGSMGNLEKMNELSAANVAAMAAVNNIDITVMQDGKSIVEQTGPANNSINAKTVKTGNLKG